MLGNLIDYLFMLQNTIVEVWSEFTKMFKNNPIFLTSRKVHISSIKHNNVALN